jgi:SIR2-like domain
MTGILERLIKKNEYPIIFVGSGISKRYLENFPSWEELLEEFWNKTNPEKNFYTYLNQLATNLKSENPEYSQQHIDYLVNTKAAREISNRYNDLFFAEKVHINNLTIKDAYKDSISPFKRAIAEKFKSYKIKPGIEKELESFKQLVKKAQIIVTTNYDSFIEDIFENELGTGITTYIGHKGFFEETEGWAELFKIHGSISDSNSIIITDEDYRAYDENSVLLSAKILAAMVNSPIIFLGYSLTDTNVQKLISDFSSQLPKEDSRKSAERMTIVEWSNGEEDIIEEQGSDHSKGWHYTLLRTDNYSLLYNKLSKINQGLSPSHVRKYNQLMRKLVVDRGRKGSLETVLLSLTDLQNVEEKINSGKPVVLAFGDDITIFVMPTLVSYMNDYIFNKGQIKADVALRFVASQPKIARIPFAKYIKKYELEDLELSSIEKEKIRDKILIHGTLDGQIQSINKYHKLDFDELEHIKKEEYKITKEIDVVVYNIKKFDEKIIGYYVEEIIKTHLNTSTSNQRSSIRRLALAYDLLINGDMTI